MRRGKLLRQKSFVVLLLALGAAVIALAGSSGWASADSAVVYSQTVVQPIPPAQNYSQSSGGDGYAVALYNGRVFNVFHHQTNVVVDCHNQSDASSCWSSPETITDGIPGDAFATPTETGLYMDQSTGKLYVYATRTSSSPTTNLTAGVVCIDTTIADTNANPFCGFTALSAAGDAPIYSGNGKSDLSLPMMVGSKWYAFNYAPGSGVSGSKNTVLCFNTANDSACDNPNQPYGPTLGTGAVTTSCTCGGEAAIGTELIIPVSMTLPGRGELVCFDTANLPSGACGGTWPVVTPSTTIPINRYGAAYPLLNTAGTTTGFCLPNGTDPCFNLNGVSVATPPGMTTAITQSLNNNGSSVVIGPRVYIPNGNTNKVDCYDYSKSAGCSNFPLAISNIGAQSLYTVNTDPQRPTCIWLNSDNGSGQIQSFDAYNGGPCVQTRVLATQFIVPQQKCYPNTYQSIQVVTPSPSDYSGGSVSFADAGGNSIPGLSSVPLDATGTASLTGLALNTPSGLPQFLITLTNAPAAAAPLTVRLTWTATPDPACLSGGQTNPSSTTLDATLSDGTNTNQTLTEWMGTPVDNNGSLSGTHAATATGFVTYHWWSDSACTTPAAPDSVQTITTPGVLPPSANVNLPAGVYYETVDYSGDSLNQESSTSCGYEVLTVKPVPTNITYTGDTSVYAGAPATISFVLKNSLTSSVLPNEPVTITLPDAFGGGTVSGTTDANGVFSTTATAPIVSSDTTYAPSESFAGQGKYLASSGPGSIVVHPIPTSVTYTGDTSVYAGDPLTVSYLLTNSLTGDPLANTPVTINLPGGGSYSTTTDSSGVASDTITAPAETSNTTIGTTESFAGQDQYLPSSGPGSVLVKVIPTSITYTGDTSVYSGQTATLSFVLTDAGNNPLANKSVTVALPAAFGGGTVSGTTDANGVFSTTATAPIVSSDTTYAPSESFAGQGKYLASSGPGSIVVHPIPTSVTYTGDTSVYAGDPLTVSYVLTDTVTGNPLANMPVTISLPGGGSYSTTTDSSGVASDTITAPLVASNTSLDTTESFDGQAQYLASSGPGSVLVKVIPTSITYTGDTSVYSGQTATLSYVLKDSGGNVLPSEPVTITVPAALGGGTVSGTTNANGVFSTTVTTPIVSSDTTYAPGEAFARQGKYLASSGAGSLVVKPIPTNVTYTGDTSVYAGTPATISFVLKNSLTGNVLANMPVTLTLPNGTTYSTTTDANGVASKTVATTTGQQPTTYSVSESFGGQAQYLRSSGPGSLTVNPIPTTTTYTGPTTVYYGTTVKLTATLAAQPTSTPLGGKTVMIAFGGLSCSGTTDSTGTASCTVVMNLPVAKYTITASFAGSGYYLPSNGPGTINVALTDTGNSSIGFWQSSGGQKIITTGATTKNVCNSGTKLRTYVPFQDLSKSASCSDVASYVATVLGNATSSGDTMNSMLKAQMLAAALDVYFSDPTLGGNQIGAPAPLGPNSYSLLNVPPDGDTSSAFGGATAMTLNKLLLYAASQSDVGGSTWYGNVKSMQVLAKDTFASIITGYVAPWK